MKKILLVEDNETIVMGLKYSLEQENFQVISVLRKAGNPPRGLPAFAYSVFSSVQLLERSVTLFFATVRSPPPMRSAFSVPSCNSKQQIQG